ncbi:MAG: hypothetical protein QE487_10055 [Fluviicola sp.]|nr:hypothetical protein [Fluviicola sp.]
MIQKSVWSIQRIFVLTTIAVVLVGFFEKRKPQSQFSKKAVTEQIAECDSDEDNDNDLIGGSDCDLLFGNGKAVGYTTTGSKVQNPIPVCGRKGKSLPKWMMYQQLKIDEPIA